MNTIVIFFSRADENYFGGSMKYVEVGNTEIAVGHITELTGFDSFKLEMVQSYSADYMTCIDEAKAHLRENARPELKDMPDVSGYDIRGVCWRGSEKPLDGGSSDALQPIDRDGGPWWFHCTR